MLQLVIAVAFWTCLALIVYAYAGYPFLLAALVRLFGKRTTPPVGHEDHLPSVSLLIAAYNEAAEIDKRIQIALMTDYPRDRLEIVIASDGSSDATAEIVRNYAHKGVRLLDYKERRGKSTVLNAAFPELTGDIVVLSDANTQMDPQAIRKLVRWFADPGVGVVCGRLILTDPETGRNVDGLYWKYETFLKKNEGRLGALLGANGGIYAIRRLLQAPIPTDTLVDDLVLPLQAKMRSGCTILYDRQAVAYEETPADISAEFGRRARIGAGGFQSLARLKGLLHPRHGWTAFTFLSHKVLRWLCPFLMIGALGANCCLIDDPLYRSILMTQIGFYFTAVLAMVVPPRVRLLKPLRLTTMFCTMNAALLVGFCRWLRGPKGGTWKRTARVAEINAPVMVGGGVP